MPLQATSGAATYDAFGGGVAAVPNYIEECFSTTLYTGNGSTQTINNGINLSGKGGLVWFKWRAGAGLGGADHFLYDTLRGAGNVLKSNTTDAQSQPGNDLSAFTSSGFTFGSESTINGSGGTYASWTFRKQPKFFDVVTYTGTGTTAQNINHNLGSVPGCIIIKRTDSTGDWGVVHRSTNAYANYGFVGGKLNTTGVVGQTVAEDTGIYYDNSTYFQVDEGSAYFNPNASGGTYVAYLFAHNSGGFGLSGTDNVISCGSYVGNGSASGPVVTLGYEPQWILVKDASFAANWQIVDNMRGLTVESDNVLRPNTSGTEYAQNLFSPTATGFNVVTTSSDVNRENSTFIYIAIRRGPMKVPTTGTSVFSPITNSSSRGTVNTTGFPVDSQWLNVRTGNSPNNFFNDRLRGVSTNAASTGVTLTSTDTSAESTSFNSTQAWDNTGFQTSQYFATASNVYWNFRRAPGFFDEVCYTGDGNLAPPPSDFKVAHNLTVRPEMVIIKRRNGTSTWNPAVAISSTQWVNGPTTGFGLNRTDPADTPFNFSTLSYATATTFSPAVVAGNTGGGFSGTTNDSGATYVAYLFASCPGVSKVGSFTGTGATQVINCGFTGGARFVLIKATSTTGNWLVWDSARGIVAGNDPYLALNSTAAEVTNTDWVDTAATGFELSNAGGNLANSNGVSYIFLAIA